MLEGVLGLILRDLPSKEVEEAMKVAMITPWGKNVRCGIRTYSENLINGIVNADKNTSIYVIRWPRFGMRTQELIQSCVVEKIPFDKVDLIHVMHEYGLFQPDIDRVFFNTIRLYNKPIVTTMHATGNPIIDGCIVNASDRIIVHNEYMKDLLPTNNKCVIIPHGCSVVQTPPRDECKKSFGIDPNIKVVGYVGFISPNKGVDILIEAMKDIRAVLLIGGGWFIGDGTDYINYLKMMSANLLGNRCAWLGYIKDEDLARVYGACDIIVYPSRYISESGAMLMAISHGKAVIAKNLLPNKEKEKEGALMTFNNKDDLISKINRLLSDDEMRVSMEKSAMQYAKANSWLKIGRKHVSLYNRILR